MIVYQELSSIEADLGIPAKTLYALSNNLSSHYIRKSIPKKNGESRVLYIPDKILKSVQRKIATFLLPLEKVSRYAKAYKPGGSVIANAKPHTGKGKILKLDIKSFFDSINYSTVKEKAFPSQRYSEKIRILLTMLCYYGDVLPQGAPTSPAISNIILYDFDNVMGQHCESVGISYTRYCDDMTFSGNIENTKELIEFAEAELFRNGFLLNKTKTKIISAHQRQKVTGIVVNEKLNISDEYRRELRREIYFIQKFGITSHLEKIRKDESPLSYLQSLLGKVNFALQIRKQDALLENYKSFLSDIIKKCSYK